MGMERTLCFVLSSFESGALISTLRTLEGALKWRFRCFLREEETLLFNFIAKPMRSKKMHVVIRTTHVMIDDVMTIENGCVSLSERNATVSCTDAIGKVMEWFSKLFGRSGKAKRDFPNLTRGKDPLELWNKTGELGDGAFGKVYKVCGSIVVLVDRAAQLIPCKL